MEPLFSQLPPLVEDLREALQPLLDKPFALFGHSLGSLVSFELARQLRTNFRSVRPAFLSQQDVRLRFPIEVGQSILCRKENFRQNCGA